MSAIVRVLFLLVVSSVSVIQSTPIPIDDFVQSAPIPIDDCHTCNSIDASVKITASIRIINKVCCR